MAEFEVMGMPRVFSLYPMCFGILENIFDFKLIYGLLFGLHSLLGKYDDN